MGVQILANAANPLMLIEAGVIPGFIRYKKFGRASSIPNGQWSTIWDASNDYPYSDNNLVNPTVVSSNAGDTQDIVLEFVDEDFNYYKEIVTLTGTTPVAITNPIMQVFRLENISPDNLAGTVTLAAGGTTYGLITNAGNNYNQSQMAIMVVPKGYYGLVTKVGFAYADNNSGEVNYRSKSFGETWKTKRPLDINEVYTENVDFFFNEKTILDVRAYPSSAGADASAWFDIILVKKEVFHKLYGVPKRFSLRG